MSLSKIRTTLKRRLIEIAKRDSRIVGLVDYGSTAEGREDEWSDLDVALFIRDVDLEPFKQTWIDWAARHDFNFIIIGNLMALLRLEHNAVERWQAQSAASNIEQILSPERLARLDQCIPAPGPESLKSAMLAAARLGHDVCAAAAAAHGWPWSAPSI